MSRVLVTGNLGYLGTPVVRRLRERGHFVMGVDTGWFCNTNIELMDTLSWGASRNLSGRYGDPPPGVQYFDDIRTWLPEPADVVVHLAGLSNDPMGELNPGVTRSINAIGTIDLLRAYPYERHVVASSCAVYGCASSMMDEESVCRPQTAYARSKRDVELWGSAGMEGHTDHVFLRLGTLYGYSPAHRLDTVVNKMVADALGPDRTVSVQGNAWRPLTHVEDAADAIVRMVESDDRGIYNCVGENMQILDVAKAVRDFTGAALLYYDETVDRRDYRANGDKLRSTGWTAHHTVAGSIPVLAERTLSLPPGRDYVRLTALRRLIDTGYLNANLERTA